MMWGEKEEQKPRGVAVVAFSRDRAFQLRELLRSWQAVRRGSEPACCFYVIWSASTAEHTKAYNHLEVQVLESAQNGDDRVVFVGELDFDASDDDDDADALTAFGHAVQFVLASCGSDYVKFVVDDMLYFEPFPLAEACALLDERSDVFSVLFALHSRVDFSHPANKACKMIYLGGLEEQPASVSASGLVVYSRLLCSGDWNYPWSFCGGLYRMEVVREVMQLMADKYGARKAWGHPNRLEACGHAVVQEKVVSGEWVDRMCSAFVSGEPVCCVVTVNRVQDVYKNRIYEYSAEDGGNDEQEKHVDRSADALLKLYWDPTAMFDLDAYRRAAREFRSVHVGNFLLES